MAINSATGAKIAIGPQVADSVDTTAEFAALAWVDIKEVESLGEFGDEAAITTFASLSDGRVRKVKGARDAGMLPLVVGHDPLDAGQIAVEAAEATDHNYGFRVTIQDGPLPASTDTVIYFRAKVASKRKNVGANGNVVRNTYNLAIDSALYTVPAA